MSQGQKLVNRTIAQARKIKRNPIINFENVNEQMNVLASSRKAQKLVLSAQRTTDPSWGDAFLAQKIEISKIIAGDVALADVGGFLQATVSSIGLAERLQFQALADAPSGIEQVAQITAVGDNSQSLNNKYFFINSANNANQYYVWFNVSSGGIDPAVSNRISVPVNIFANSSASVVASAVAAALNLLNSGNDFTAVASGAGITVTNKAVGPAVPPLDPAPMLQANTAEVTYVVPASLNRGTGFSFSLTTAGQAILALAGKYLVLNDSAGSVAVWFHVGGTGSAPVGFHRTIEVSFASLASAPTVAQAIAAALAADSQFTPSSASGSLLSANNVSAGYFGLPGNGTSTFSMKELQRGNIDISNLALVNPGDLMEVLGGELKGQYFTIASIANNVLTMSTDGAGETGESGISVRFEMRTTIPKILTQPQYQE